jgi:hypothetical protein
MIQAIAVDQPPCEAVAAALYRPLRRQEAKLIARTAHKIQRIARLEHKETMRFTEGKAYARVARTSRA